MSWFSDLAEQVRWRYRTNYAPRFMTLWHPEKPHHAVSTMVGFPRCLWLSDSDFSWWYKCEAPRSYALIAEARRAEVEFEIGREA